MNKKNFKKISQQSLEQSEQDYSPGKVKINHFVTDQEEEEEETDQESIAGFTPTPVLTDDEYQTDGAVTSNIDCQKSLLTKTGAGFTLIEILVVIGIIAILALIVLVAINPARQFALSRNTQRTSNVNAILNAIGQNMVDNKGVFTCAAGSLPASAKDMADASSDAAGYDIAPCLTPTYISALPFDPSAVGGAWVSATSYRTNYTVKEDVTTQRVTVCAPTSEPSVGNSAICITR